MPRELEAKKVAAALDCRESDEPRALGYLQRLNLAGYDVKGQISSAYGQSGIGLSVSVSIDFGAMFVRFVHGDASANIGAEPRTAHSLLVLQRMPHRAWLDDMVQPPQPPKKDPNAPSPPFPRAYWTATRPLVLALLQGSTSRLKAGVAADAWAGLGTLDFDETGLAIGAQAGANIGGVLTRLVDPAPRHYPPTPSDSSLNEDVDDLFEENLKAKAAAWLIETGGGVKDILELGAPRMSLVEQAEQDSNWEKFETFVMPVL